jgi:hypothetical protein
MLNSVGVWEADVGYPPGYSPKTKNEPEKCFRINKNIKNEPENEPERTRDHSAVSRPSALESARLLGFRENEFETNLKTNPRRVSGELQ